MHLAWQFMLILINLRNVETNLIDGMYSEIFLSSKSRYNWPNIFRELFYSTENKWHISGDALSWTNMAPNINALELDEELKNLKCKDLITHKNILLTSA